VKIISIGGGELKEKETLKIDRFAVDLTGKRHPQALFIPTASGDSFGYCQTFDRIYGRLLGCRTDHLLLLKRDRNRREIQEKIFQADLIYAGGGNTLRMMKQWRRDGVDAYLLKAGKQGTVLCGLSAGAICWHEWGHSDSRSFSGKSDWSHIRVRGLGFQKGIFCPHLRQEKRNRPFTSMIEQYHCFGLACDNCAAIYYEGDKATCITSDTKAHAYTYQWSKTKARVVQCLYSNREVIVRD